VALVKFAILFAVLLPFVPDQQFGPEGIVNPKDIAWVVFLVSLLGFVGYIFLKFGKPEKGILLTAMLGGLFSSTAVTWAYSAKSKEQKELAHLYASGILLASSIMFARILFFTYLFNVAAFNILILPCGIMVAILLTSMGLTLWKKKNHQSTHLPELGSPLELTNAIFFAFIYTTIIYLVFYANKFWGANGLYVSGVISGFSDVDAITINMSKLSDKTEVRVASAVIMLASFSNNLMKMIIGIFRGDSSLRRYIGITFMAVLLASLLFFLIESHAGV